MEKTINRCSGQVNTADFALLMSALFLILAVVSAIIGVVHLVIYFCGESPVMDWNVVMETAKVEVIVIFLVISAIFFLVFYLLHKGIGW